VLGLVALIGLYEAVAGGGIDTGSPPHHAARQENGESEHRRYEDVTTVTAVVGGDTIRIAPAIDGTNVVRLIGVDAPDAGKRDAEGQPYSQRASRFTRSVLDGRKVRLEFDVQRKDRYGRLLAYVYPMGDEMLNEVLLRKGYAQVYTLKPNDEREGEFAGEQEKARDDGLGIWGLPEAKRCKLANHGNGIGKGSPACKARLHSPPKNHSKPEHARAASNGSSVGPDLDCSDLTYRQAQAEMAADPSDPFNLDQDGDGVACEGLRGGGAASAAATASAESSAPSTASPNP
jgi:micrococcal nuclease